MNQRERAKYLADQLREHVRTMPGGGEQFLDQLEALAAGDEDVEPGRATVILFKPSGKYYAVDHWRIPDEVPDWSEARGNYMRRVIGPNDMRHSPDFRRIDGGAVLVPDQEPWGFPHLFPSEG